jgi:hypothetical protein
MQLCGDLAVLTRSCGYLRFRFLFFLSLPFPLRALPIPLPPCPLQITTFLEDQLRTGKGLAPRTQMALRALNGIQSHNLGPALAGVVCRLLAQPEFHITEDTVMDVTQSHSWHTTLIAASMVTRVRARSPLGQSPGTAEWLMWVVFPASGAAFSPTTPPARSFPSHMCRRELCGLPPSLH